MTCSGKGVRGRGLLLLAGSDVELEVDHITVLHDVVLALLAVLAGGLDFGGVRGGLERLVVLETGCARSNALKTRG